MITILTPHFPPVYEYGGPNKSLAGVCTWLSQEGIPYQVISKIPQRSGGKHKNANSTAYVHFKERIRLQDLIGSFGKSDVIWINTLYSYDFSVLPLLALMVVRNKTILVSPRGQLLKGALNLKKRVFLRLFKVALQLSGSKTWVHFANEQEKLKSYRIFNNYPVVQFNNAISGTMHPKAANQTDNNKPFTLGYFGRVSAIKNIEFALKLLPNLPKVVNLEIHGSVVNSKYQSQLEKLIEKLQIQNRVSFNEKYNIDTFASKSKGVDLILIPSHSESFCHVFFEVIEARKLVLASTGLPWEAINDFTPNTVLPLDPKIWLARINQVRLMSNEQYKQEQEQLITYYKSIYARTKEDTINAIKKIYNEHETTK